MTRSDRFEIRRPIFVVILCSILLSCTSPGPVGSAQFISFEEPQRTWPTQPFGLVQLIDGFPVYGRDQFPPEPYEMLGTIHVPEPFPAASPSTEELSSVVQMARAEHGQAVLLRGPQTTGGRTTRAGTEYSVIRFPTNTIASVMKRIDLYLNLQPGGTNLNVDPVEQKQLREELDSLRRSVAPR